MVASGNDFVIINNRHHVTTSPRHRLLAKKMCDRKFGAGADGLLLLEKSRIADVRMRIFNADGSEAEMCGNGARCVALYVGKRGLSLETRAGIIQAKVNKDNVKIRLTDPKKIKLNIPIKVNNRVLKVNFINTGVPHTVIFVEGLDKIDVFNLGRQIRNHNKFSPAGTNVDFVEVLNKNSLKVRTYERGVEDETLACGTGAVASSLIAYRLSHIDKNPTVVLTRSGEILKVYFERETQPLHAEAGFKNVWLEGKARIVYKGEYYV